MFLFIRLASQPVLFSHLVIKLQLDSQLKRAASSRHPNNLSNQPVGNTDRRIIKANTFGLSQDDGGRLKFYKNVSGYSREDLYCTGTHACDNVLGCTKEKE